MELLLIALAPILQIILSILRVAGKINIPTGLIAVLAILAGGFFSMKAGSLEMDAIAAKSPVHSHCGMPFVAIFIGGTFVDSIAAVIIGIICGVTYYQIKKNRAANTSTLSAG